jgi:hypothetical protein
MALAVSDFGSLRRPISARSAVLADSGLSDSKSPQRIFRCGLDCCDDENVSVSCPTCQLFDAQICSMGRLQSAGSG